MLGALKDKVVVLPTKIMALIKGDRDDSMVPLDYVTRFYQSDYYHSLSPALRSAFYAGPLGAMDQRIESERGVEFLKTALEQWQAGRSHSYAVFGETGTGLSTLLNVYTGILKKQDIPFNLIPFDDRISTTQSLVETLFQPLGIEYTSSAIDNIISAINQLDPKVIMLDNVHFLVQRSVKSQSLIDTFSAIILATRSKHLWIVGCEEQSWRRLSYGYGINDSFSHEHHLENFTEEKIRKLLIARFAYAGFDTINGQPIGTSKNEKSPIYSIARKSKGCIELGLFYCLNNFTHGTNEKSVFLSMPKDIDTTMLKKLGDLDLFTLAEICTHGQLTAREHQNIFRCTLNKSKVVLEKLRVLGLLDHDEDGRRHDAYVLKLIVSAVVIRYLISINYLY